MIEPQLQAAIAAAPANRTAHRVYADWLEEHGNPLCALWRSFEPLLCPLQRDHHGPASWRYTYGDGGQEQRCGYGDGDGCGDGKRGQPITQFNTGGGVGSGRTAGSATGRGSGWGNAQSGDGHSRTCTAWRHVP